MYGCTNRFNALRVLGDKFKYQRLSKTNNALTTWDKDDPARVRKKASVFKSV